MFDIENRVKNLLGNSFRLRGKEYFYNNLIKNITIYDENDYINFSGEVTGNEIYDTVIGIKKDKSIGLFCTCPSFKSVGYCKHLAGLAMKISSLYQITDELYVIIKKTSKKIDLSEEEYKEKESVNDGYLDFLMDEDFFKKNKSNIALLKFLGLKPGVNNQKQEGKLSIFNEISNNNLVDVEEEKLFKIKLSFIEVKKEFKDICIGLYKCKMQKNGTLTPGALVVREKLNEAPLKFNLLSPYIETNSSRNNYYRANDYLTFSSSGKSFIDIIFELDEIYDKNNNQIFVHKDIYSLKINIQKENDSYIINLILVGNNSNLVIKGHNIYGNVGSSYFACVLPGNNLYFFTSNLNYNFIKNLTKNDIILKERDFRKLKEKKEFNEILKNIFEIDSLGIKYDNIDPECKLRIEIPNDYSLIKIENVIHYDDIEISKEDTNNSILVKEKRIIKRDIKKENSLLSNFLLQFDEYYKNIGIKYINDNIDSFFDDIEKLINNGTKVEYKQKTKRVTSGNLKINLKVNSGVDFFDIESKIMLGDKELNDAKEILSKARKGAKYINLENGNTIILKNDISKETKKLEAIGINDKDIGKSVKIGKYNIGLLRNDTSKSGNLLFDLDKNALELKNKIKDFKNINKVILPKNSKIKLRDYQKTGVDFINFLEEYNFSGILADDMGLGKTIQTLSFLETKYNTKSKIGKTIIICPTSLVLNWMDEAEKFTPHLKIEYLKDSKNGINEIKKDTQIIVVSYGIIANIVDNGDLKETFEYIILDEAQNIKNPVAQRTRAISELKGKNRLALSGTPIENNLIELWSIFNFLMPGFLGTLNHFKSTYSSVDKEVLDILSKKIKPFILRRTKEEVLKDLPPKVEEYIKLEMNDKQKSFYNKLKNTYKIQIEKKLEEEGLNKSRFYVLDALLKLRQACLMPELVAIEGNNLKDSIKLEYIEENIEEMIGNKHNLLIFSQFTGFLHYVKELLNNKGIKFNYLDGQVPIKERKKLVDSFNAGEVNVFIISLKAGGSGLNLTSADYVIHLDPWWNPAVENQATDRAHRIGQEKTVFVQKLIVKDSIEEKILKLQENKKKLIDDVFSGNFSGKLEKSDIDFIFS